MIDPARPQHEPAAPRRARGCDGLAPCTSSRRSTKRRSRGCARRDEFFWIDLVSPADEEVEQLGEALDLHPVALEDTRSSASGRSSTPTSDHAAARLLHRAGDRRPDWPAEPLEVHVYISGDFIATVRRDRCTALDDLHDDARRGADARRGGARLPRPRRADRRLLPGDRRARERRSTRSRPQVLDPPAARAAQPQLPAQAERPRAAPARRRPARPVPRPRHERDPRPRGPRRKGSRPYLRDIGDHLHPDRRRVPAPDRGPARAHPDLLQRELRPAQRGRHAADRSAARSSSSAPSSPASSARTSAGW